LINKKGEIWDKRKEELPAVGIRVEHNKRADPSADNEMNFGR
jgi:hypothetical protein